MNPLYPVARRRAGPTARNKPERGTVLPGFWQVPFYGGLGLLMIVIGTVGRGYALATLFVGTVLVAGALLIGVRRRRPRLLLLIDFWLLGFVYLFSSELAIESGDVLRDFGIVLSSASEGFIVAAFGASLAGYALTMELLMRARRGSAAPLVGRMSPAAHDQRVSLRTWGPPVVLSTLVIVCGWVTLLPGELLGPRFERVTFYGEVFNVALAALVVQIIAALRLFTGRGPAWARYYCLAGALASLLFLYAVGTRYFLGFAASGLLFYLLPLTRPVGARRLALLACGVLTLAALQASMRLARNVGLAKTDLAAVTSNLSDPRAFLSPEGMLRVNAWVHQKRAYDDNRHALENMFFFYWWVPRRLWPSKPKMDGYWVAREVMYEGPVGTSQSVAGGFGLPPLVDFGPNLGTLFCLLYGAALAWLESFAMRHRDPADRASLLTAILPFAVFFATRSPQTSIIFVQLCAVVYLPSFIAHGRQRPRRRLHAQTRPVVRGLYAAVPVRWSTLGPKSRRVALRQ